ncbi:MAG: multicopper oxidase domain-containing protein [Opitutaceae bacterium]|nr:multicopper oxidase domain-containing protein [Opitutaceae bacterium]
MAGDKPSAHAVEMAGLVKNSGWEGAQRMFATILGSTAAVSPAVAAVAKGAPNPPGRSTLPGVAAATAAVRPASTVSSPAAESPAHPFQDIIDRDKRLGIWETSYVPPGTPPDKKFTLVMQEGDVFLGNGVIYSGFNVNGTIPGPTLVAEEGDVIELTAVNKGEIAHGMSIHAAYTQTSKYFGRINAGQSKTHTFRVNHPGVYMYHCAPGGHAIPMHTLLGQYGIFVVKPKTVKFKMEEVMGRKPDIEIYLVQHELFASGKDAIEGRAAYVMFNGKLFRYADSPIKARPGDFVRVNFLNVGPNLTSTFHLVGIIWDYAYWQGNPTPGNTFTGGQSVIAGPSDSWVVDFRVPPDEGAYLMVTHAFGSATRGAIGILQATKDAERDAVVSADGPSHTPEQLEALKAKAVRIISPSSPGSEELANPYVLPPGVKKLRIQIIGNSYWPKVAVVPPGTTVEWVNEDVFTFYSGEFAGIHDVVTSKGPQDFASPMLGHGEKFSTVLTKKGEYQYYCTPHPYMEAIIRVADPNDAVAAVSP